jgi:hypothetical protein
MGLKQFHDQRHIWRDKFYSMLIMYDPSACASALYVLGVRQDRYFLNDILAISSSPAMENERVRRCMAWCLCRYRHPLGTELFIQLLMELSENESSQVPLHFFAQLSTQERFRIIEQMIYRYPDNRSRFLELFGILKASPYDFHEEINFIFLQISKE